MSDLLKHSPAPWKLVAENGEIKLLDATHRYMATFCLRHNHLGYEELRQADAQLVAGAPDLLKVGRQMRAAQSNYFKTRTKESLQTALALEKQFDALIDKYEVEDET